MFASVIFAVVTALLASLFASIVPSLGVPTKRGSPIARMKSILSEEDNALENVRVLPDTVNELPGF